MPSRRTATVTAGSAISMANGAKRISATMRQTHAAGEKLFVDYAGDTVPVFDQMTGRGASRAHLRRRARGVQLHLCRGALVEGLADWIGAHVNALTAIGGVPKAVVLRQSEGRGHQAVALRARHQSHLSGPGGALRLCGAADAGDASRATRPRWKSPSSSSSASSWRGCGTGGSSRWWS